MDWSRLSSSLGLVTGFGTVVLALFTAMIWILYEWARAKALLCKEVLWNAAFRDAIISRIENEDPIIESARDASEKVSGLELQEIANFCQGFL